jgi:hypothetical protein
MAGTLTSFLRGRHTGRDSFTLCTAQKSVTCRNVHSFSRCVTYRILFHGTIGRYCFAAENRNLFHRIFTRNTGISACFIFKFITFANKRKPGDFRACLVRHCYLICRIHSFHFQAVTKRKVFPHANSMLECQWYPCYGKKGHDRLAD